MKGTYVTYVTMNNVNAQHTMDLVLYSKYA